MVQAYRLYLILLLLHSSRSARVLLVSVPSTTSFFNRSTFITLSIALTHI